MDLVTTITANGGGYGATYDGAGGAGGSGGAGGGPGGSTESGLGQNFLDQRNKATLVVMDLLVKLEQETVVEVVVPVLLDKIALLISWCHGHGGAGLQFYYQVRCCCNSCRRWMVVVEVEETPRKVLVVVLVEEEMEIIITTYTPWWTWC